jgi:RNA polymerase sigma-70 factor, ECF subfamily
LSLSEEEEIREIVDIASLVGRWQRGEDREAVFKLIFERYYRAVLSFFLKRGFSQSEAQELTQESFIRVYKGMDSFRGEAPFEAWLFQLTANLYRNALRTKATQKRLAQEVSLAEITVSGADLTAIELKDLSAISPLEGVVVAERNRVLREAVNSLPDQMRRCLTLRVYQDMSYQEIAQVMRLSIETVKAHLFQGRKQLKLKLAPYFEQIEI